jgi:pyruvate kinase
MYRRGFILYVTITSCVMTMKLSHHTSIIATVGPSCQKAETLRSLARHGVSVFRINASHTGQKQLKQWFHLTRTAFSGARIQPPILLDLQGPRIRTGALKDAKSIRLVSSQIVQIRASQAPGSGDVITTRCMSFPQMLKVNDCILIDNGNLKLEVTRLRSNQVFCRVIQGGLLGENKGINIPHIPSVMPSLTEKDKKDLSVSLALRPDYIALSFVRNAKDILALKRWLKKRGKSIPIISKIEKSMALDHYDEILEVSDGIMVARGDLGIEMGLEKVPIIQKELIYKAGQSKKVVIVATEMLESMMESPKPTRAEVSDVANAVLDGADAVMLSGETSIGQYPLKAVQAMKRIIRELEPYKGRYHQHPILY